MEKICQLFGMTRQAYYKAQTRSQESYANEAIILAGVRQVREQQPMVGGRKLFYQLQGLFQSHGIKIGRDKFFNLLRTHHLLIRRKKRFARTTDSYHRFRCYKNLVNDLPVTFANQVFVADITYIDTLEGFCYLALITDVFSRKIVGYALSQSLSVEFCIEALRMALKGVTHPKQLIHHSDRGIQYCCSAYVDILKSHGVKISMTEENHVYENALAERVNGILKQEFMLGLKLRSFAIAKELVKQAIAIYNKKRLHMAIGYMTPEEKYQMSLNAMEGSK